MSKVLPADGWRVEKVGAVPSAGYRKAATRIESRGPARLRPGSPLHHDALGHGAALRRRDRQEHEQGQRADFMSGTTAHIPERHMRTRLGVAGGAGARIGQTHWRELIPNRNVFPFPYPAITSVSGASPFICGPAACPSRIRVGGIGRTPEVSRWSSTASVEPGPAPQPTQATCAAARLHSGPASMHPSWPAPAASQPRSPDSSSDAHPSRGRQSSSCWAVRSNRRSVPPGSRQLGFRCPWCRLHAARRDQRNADEQGGHSRQLERPGPLATRD